MLPDHRFGGYYATASGLASLILRRTVLPLRGSWRRGRSRRNWCYWGARLCLFLGLLWLLRLLRQLGLLGQLRLLRLLRPLRLLGVPALTLHQAVVSRPVRPVRPVCRVRRVFGFRCPYYAALALLRTLRFTHLTHFRSTPSGSDDREFHASGFAGAHPEVKHDSTPSGSWRRCTLLSFTGALRPYFAALASLRRFPMLPIALRRR